MMDDNPLTQAAGALRARWGMILVELAAKLRVWWQELTEEDCPLLIDEAGNLRDEPLRIHRKDDSTR